MTINQKQLWKATTKNLGVSVLVFSGLLCLLWLAELLFEQLQGQLLHFDQTAWVVGIPASIIGVCYILSIKDPENYTGFYAGIIMSILLGIQFLLQGQYDSTFLYFCVFIPFQVMSILNWSKPKKEAEEPFSPSFLSMKGMLLSVLALCLITLADYLLATYLFQHNSLSDAILVKLMNGLLISSSVLANFWLIYRKNDSWLYWLLYSVSGIVLFIIIGNIFSIVLFTFFLVINSMAGIAWIKSTPKDNYGWLNGK